MELSDASRVLAGILVLSLVLSVTRPGATAPNRLVLLVPIGGVVPAIGLVTLGIGLLTA